MTDGIAVLEADHYREEEARLKQDAGIIAMAEALKHFGQVEEFLNDRNAMMMAFREAQSRGIDFQSIGGPHRALRALLTE